MAVRRDKLNKYIAESEFDYISYFNNILYGFFKKLWLTQGCIVFTRGGLLEKKNSADG